MPASSPRPLDLFSPRRRIALVGTALLIVTLGPLVPAPGLAVEYSARVDTEPVSLRVLEPGSMAGASVSSGPGGPIAPARGARTTELAPFRMVGFSWNGSDALAVAVRVHSPAGWSNWHTLRASDGGPDPGSPEHHGTNVVTTEPVWVSRADGYEVAVPGGVTGLRAHLVRADERLTIRATEARAGAHLGPPIHGRGSWGARPPAYPVQQAPRSELSFVHHSATTNSYGPNDVPAILRSIQAYHINANGWADIAYNFAVDRFGRVWEARADSVLTAPVGGHTRGFNAQIRSGGVVSASVGVVVLGDFTAASPPNGIASVVGRIIGWKLALSGQDPNGSTVAVSNGNAKYPEGTQVVLPNVAGHLDAQSTSCPGRLYGQLGTVRLWAGQEASPLRDGAIFDPFPAYPGGASVASGQIDPGEGSELVAGRGPGLPSAVATFDATGAARATLAPYAPYAVPVNVATGDIDGDGDEEVITGVARYGGPDIRVFDEGGTLLRQFYAYVGSYNGGVHVAAGDVDGDGRDEIVTGTNVGAGPHTRVFRDDGSSVAEWNSYIGTFLGGVRVATGDVDGDGNDEVVTAPGPGGGPHVRVFDVVVDPVDGIVVTGSMGFHAYDPSFLGGVAVATVLDPAVDRDLVVTGPGRGGGPHLRFLTRDGGPRGEVMVGSQSNTFGLQVAGGLFGGGTRPGVAVAYGPGAPTAIRIVDVATGRYLAG